MPRVATRGSHRARGRVSSPVLKLDKPFGRYEGDGRYPFLGRSQRPCRRPDRTELGRGATGGGSDAPGSRPCGQHPSKTSRTRSGGPSSVDRGRWSFLVPSGWPSRCPAWHRRWSIESCGRWRRSGARSRTVLAGHSIPVDEPDHYAGDLVGASLDDPVADVGKEDLARGVRELLIEPERQVPAQGPVALAPQDQGG